MYKKADTSLYDPQYQKQLIPKNPTYQQNVKKQPQPATAKNNTNNQSATSTDTVKSNIVPSSTGFSNFEQRLASVRGKGYSNWDFGGSYGDPTYSTIKDYNPNSDPTAVAFNDKAGKQALQYMQGQEKQRQLSAQKNKTFNENIPVANNTDNATVPIATIQKNKNNKWDWEYFNRLNSRIQQLQNRLKVPTTLNERAYLEAHLKAAQSELPKWTTNNYTKGSYTIPSMQQTPTMNKQQALFKRQANRPLSAAYNNAKANFDAYSQRRQAEFNRQKFNPDGSWRSVNRVTPRLSNNNVAKAPNMQASRNKKTYDVNGVRQQFRDKKYNVYNSLQDFRSNPKQQGVYVDDYGKIYNRYKKGNGWIEQTRHARDVLGKRFRGLSAKEEAAKRENQKVNAQPYYNQAYNPAGNSSLQYSPMVNYTNDQIEAAMQQQGIKYLDPNQRASINATGYYKDKSGNIRFQQGSREKGGFRDLRGSTYLEQLAQNQAKANQDLHMLDPQSAKQQIQQYNLNRAGQQAVQHINEQAEIAKEQAAFARDQVEAQKKKQLSSTVPPAKSPLPPTVPQSKATSSVYTPTATDVQQVIYSQRTADQLNRKKENQQYLKNNPYPWYQPMLNTTSTLINDFTSLPGIQKLTLQQNKFGEILRNLQIYGDSLKWRPRIRQNFNNTMRNRQAFSGAMDSWWDSAVAAKQDSEIPAMPDEDYYRSGKWQQELPWYRKLFNSNAW